MRNCEIGIRMRSVKKTLADTSGSKYSHAYFGHCI